MANISNIFTSKDLIISSDTPRDAYHRRNTEIKTVIHWGQRKLYLSEVEFFALHWNQVTNPNPLCVYAGAAPGTHITLLSEMFPSFTFHLYDPHPIEIKETDKIKIFSGYFTDDIAKQYANRNDVFFISDIRSVDYKENQKKALAKRGITKFDTNGNPVGSVNVIKEATKEADLQTEKEVWQDMLTQQNWILIMNPVEALIKFRLPYSLDGKDRKVQYLKGIVYWQAWSPSTTSETRLKPTRNAAGAYEIADWSILEYEQWCFYQNSSVRENNKYKNIFTNTDDPIDPPELLNDYDSTAEAMILKLYFEKMGVTNPTSIFTNVKKLSKLITWTLNHRPPVGETLTKTLNNYREAPVKTSNKAFNDAFKKQKNIQVITTTSPKSPGITTSSPAVPITIPKSPAIIIRSPAVPITIPKSPGITTRSPAVPITIPNPTVITSPITIPKSPIRSPAVPITISAVITSPITIPKSPIRSPAVPITIPAVITSPIPVAKSPIRSPAVSITIPVVAPLIKPVVTSPITIPVIAPLIKPVVTSPITIPVVAPLIKPVVMTPVVAPLIKPVVMTPSVTAPEIKPTAISVLKPMVMTPVVAPLLKPVVKI